MPSLPAAAGARGGNAGLADPLLANGGDGARKISANDKYWVAADEEEMRAVKESGGEDGRPLLFRTFKVKGALLHPYRALIFIRLIGVILFFAWRIKHNNSDVVWFWVMSVAGDIWFGFSWLLNQVPKFNPIKTVPNLAALRQQYDLPDSNSKLPGIDIFVTTADPVNEPTLCTMNSILSILAADYPVERYACYLSDDSGSLIICEALVEAAKFATLWVPFCRKHCIEPRAPENYFESEARPYVGRALEEFMNDREFVRNEYHGFKMRLDTLPSIIRHRSDTYNIVNARLRDPKATWMANGTQWPGTWIDPAENHTKGHHAGIVQIILEHPNHGPQPGQPTSNGSPLNFRSVDIRLPMLVYVSREKHPSDDHNKKAGALNAQLRISALLSNAPFVMNFDCDHYINNSQALRAAICFMLDRREGDSIAFVQFPQRFDNVDPTDRYGNHNRVFFDGTMLSLNGIQGPTYLGTGCVFRRAALYGIGPPRRRPKDVVIKANKFGSSTPFLNSIAVAMKQDRAIKPPPPLDESLAVEMRTVVSSAYDKETDWGRGVGYIYNIATEDIVTGFRIHGQGWRSMYCTLETDAFHGTAPINLTERLYQIVRWSGGSLEMFFSHNNPLLAGRRLHPMQRLSYLNNTTYPITSLFILLYAFCPVMWLFPDEMFIQRPFIMYVLYLVMIIVMIHMISVLEIKWAGITWLDCWRNEQFFMIGSTSAYPTAVLHMMVKLLTKKGIHFRVTSKQTSADRNEKFADLYVVRWVPMLIPTVTVLAANILAVGVAMGKAIVYVGVWSTVQKWHAGLGLLFNVWIMALLYPFALAIMGRWGKRPIIFFTVLPIVFLVVCLMYIVLHSFVDFLPYCMV